jgi:hypothetical protein
MKDADAAADTRRNRKAKVKKFQGDHQQPILTLRRTNLQALAEIHGGRSKLSEMLGYRQPSFLSQMLGSGWNRVVTEKSARNYELALKLPVGYLDKLIISDSTKEPLAQENRAQTGTDSIAPTLQVTIADVLATSVALIVKVTCEINHIVETQNIDITGKQAMKLIRLTVEDAAEHGFQVRESYVKQLLEMIK